MYDSHIHTNASHDSQQTYDMICQSAIEKGLKGVTFTDHVDLLVYTDEKNTNTLKETVEYAQKAKKLYGNKIEILTGVEFAMACLDKPKASEFIKMIDADVVLGSVHSFKANEKLIRLSRDDLSEDVFSKDELYSIVESYFNTLYTEAKEADINILCHLTYPIRYTNQKFNRNIDINEFSDIFEKILKTIIERGIALEVNTGKFKDNKDELSPNPPIIKKYFEMGGRLITLGSDAHISERIGFGFGEVKKELKDIGFENYVYYKNRKPVFVKF